MKKLLLATTCLALTSTVSLAADIAVPYAKGPVAAAPVFSWTGCYVGAHVGGGTLTSNFEGTNNSNGKGAVGGGQAGCNYQDGNWVFGLEGEGYWSGIKLNSPSSTIPNNIVFPGNSGSSRTLTVTNTDDFTIAARVGIAFDRTLIYGKGGWAWGYHKFDSSFVDLDRTGVVDGRGSESLRGTLDGPLFGVGIEHALTRNWTVKLEYNFIAYGSKELARSQCNFDGVCGVTGTNSLSSTKQIFKVGANYLFDIGGAPLVAKY